jgi:hypothetical protein
MVIRKIQHTSRYGFETRVAQQSNGLSSFSRYKMMVKLIFFGGAKYAIFRDTHIHPLILVVMYPIIYTCIYI